MTTRQLSFEVAQVEINLGTSFIEPDCTGFSHVQFIMDALRLNRPALRNPIRYWAEQWAKRRAGESGLDPFTETWQPR